MNGTVDSNALEEEKKTDDIRLWKYIKEGNSSFVIGHKKKHIVYHLWKHEAKYVSGKVSRKKKCWAKINYIKKCLQPILGKYASIPECISVNSDFIHSVMDAFESQRPLKRRHQIVDPDQTSVLCSPNFCFLDATGKPGRSTLTVELKPKLGYIPCHQLKLQGSEDRKPVCLFCMQQRLKRKEGVWNYTSKYCPVNLFSGNADRMRHALEGLFQTPQNNLCIFKDGELMYPKEGKSLPTQEDQDNITRIIQTWFGCEKESSLSLNDNRLPSAFSQRVCIQDLISLVIQALCQSDNASTFQEITEGSFPWIPCQQGQNHGLNCKDGGNKCQLPKGCVLERILAMQHVDTYGIDVIHKVYQRYIDHLMQYPEDKERLDIADSSSPPTIVKQRLNSEDISSLSIENCVNILQRYMMSRTARDCSILITFKPADHSSTTCDDILSVKEDRFHFECHLVDLDSKSSSKIPYYHKLEHLISETYTQEEKGEYVKWKSYSRPRFLPN